MRKTLPQRLGDLQLRIMKVLWEREEASVAEVHENVQSPKPLAYTTVATMLRKLEERGVVDHRVEGRSYIYRPTIAEADVSRGMLDHVVDRVFEGSLADTVSHLLTTREVNGEELQRLEALIAEKKKQLNQPR